jgi:hypothetical protein
VQVGVLQGDTLAPFLFILVVDGILKQLDESIGVLLSDPAPRRTTRRVQHLHSSEEVRIPTLAFADDIVLLTHSTGHLQRQLTRLETLSNAVGLFLNMGAGKTECFAVNDPPDIAVPLVTLSGAYVPRTYSYKYLGVYALDFHKDFPQRIGKAWAILRKHEALWQSTASNDIKRNLCRALVEPVLTYGMLTWPLHKTQCDTLDSAYGRMLRYALGLPPPAISRHTCHTEQFYWSQPFLSAQISARRIAFIGHALRMHMRERNSVHHLFLSVLAFDPSTSVWPRFSGGQRRTLRQQLLLDTNFGGIDSLFHCLANRTRCRQLLLDVQHRVQQRRWDTILRSRHLATFRQPPASYDEDDTWMLLGST